jgi:uncharacterized protein (TIGR02996 family)
MDISALEATLRERPDDWPAWLVFGDWLLERGDPRGELIALEGQRRAMARPSSEIDAEVSAITKTHSEAWLGGAPRSAVTWRHGFIVGLTLLLDAADTPARLKSVLASPGGRLVSKLSLRLTTSDDEDFDEEEAYEDDDDGIPRRKPTDPGTLRALAGLDLRRLTALDLAYCGVGRDGAKALAALDIGDLRSLDLRGNALGDEGVAALSRAPWFSSPTLLDLHTNAIGPTGVSALCHAASPRLSFVDLRRNPVAAEGAAALGNAPFAPALERLLLYRDDVGDEGVKALADAAALPAMIRRFWRAR